MGWTTKPKKSSKWRKQSLELRNALKNTYSDSATSTKDQQTNNPNRNSQTSKNIQNKNQEVEEEDDVNDDGFIECPTCKRRFNEKAAERHIPKVS